MNLKPLSPRIIHLSWGCLKIEGRAIAFKDAKLFPGGAREWNWNETGTHHEPGIQPADIMELLEHGTEIVILSTGMQERLQVCPETLHLLQAQNIPVRLLQTEKAVQVYNQLRKKARVGGLFHTTC